MRRSDHCGSRVAPAQRIWLLLLQSIALLCPLHSAAQRHEQGRISSLPSGLQNTVSLNQEPSHHQEITRGRQEDTPLSTWASRRHTRVTVASIQPSEEVLQEPLLKSKLVYVQLSLDLEQGPQVGSGAQTATPSSHVVEPDTVGATTVQGRQGRTSVYQSQVTRGGGAFLSGPDQGLSLQCRGRQCPRLYPCGPSFPSVSACWSPEFADRSSRGSSGSSSSNRRGNSAPAWTGQVFLLKDVFVNRHGQVFNRTHFFDTNGCAAGRKLVYPRGTTVVAFPRLVNLITSGDDPSMFRQIVETFPLMLQLAPLMPSLHNVPFAVSDTKLLHAVGSQMFGRQISALRLHQFEEHEERLFFVKSLFQPIHQHCSSPSPSLWRSLRLLHLLPPQGLPVFDQEWRERGRENPLSALPGKEVGEAERVSLDSLSALLEGAGEGGGGAGEGAGEEDNKGLAKGGKAQQGQEEEEESVFEVPDEWFVVLAQLPKAQGLADLGTAKRILGEAFSPQRVVVYRGDLSLKSAKWLFNRAILLVGASSVALTNLMFMPPSAILVDIRPPLHKTLMEEVEAKGMVFLSGGEALERENKAQQSGSGSSGESLPLDPRATSTTGLARACQIRHFSLFCLEEKAEKGDVGRRIPQSALKLACEPRSLRRAIVKVKELLFSEHQQQQEEAGDGKEEEDAGSRTTGAEDGRRGATRGGGKRSEGMDGTSSATTPLSQLEKEAAVGKGSQQQGPRRIPGSRLRHRSSLSSFRWWQLCVVERGKWWYDGTPRPLPWDFSGRLSSCDVWWVEARKGMAGVEADRAAAAAVAAVAGGGPEGGVHVAEESWRHVAAVEEARWGVRDTLKYVWRTPKSCGKWAPFDPEALCSGLVAGRKGLRVLFIGDTSALHMAHSFVSSALQGSGGHRERSKEEEKEVMEIVPLECTEQQAGGMKNRLKMQPHPHCRTFIFSLSGSCPGLVVDYVKSADLSLNASWTSKAGSTVSWANLTSLAIADAVIISEPSDEKASVGTFAESLHASLRRLREQYPGKLLLYRNSPSAHTNCSLHSRPIRERQELSGLGRVKARHSEAIRDTVASFGAVYLDVEPMTALRPDGHLGWHKGGLNPSVNGLRECMHYCAPGPVDVWSQLLFNVLLRLLPPW